MKKCVVRVFRTSVLLPSVQPLPDQDLSHTTDLPTPWPQAPAVTFLSKGLLRGNAPLQVSLVTDEPHLAISSPHQEQMLPRVLPTTHCT